MEKLTGLLVPEVAVIAKKEDSESEKYLEPKLVRDVKRLKGLAFKFRSPANKSVPDRIILIAGFVFFVEVKSTGKKPTPAQRLKHEEIRAAGGKVFVISRPSQEVAFINYLKRLIRYV